MAEVGKFVCFAWIWEVGGRLLNMCICFHLFRTHLGNWKQIPSIQSVALAQLENDAALCGNGNVKATELECIWCGSRIDGSCSGSWGGGDAWWMRKT